jgi:uncharacterized protein YbjT (DUF2867 family)
VKIPASGETSLRAVLGGKELLIKFHTVVLRKSDPGFPLALDDYSEVSIVRGMSIAVDGNSLVVPRSVYADLFNVRGAELTLGKGVFKIMTGGAHGSDTYSVHIYFDAKRLIKRESYDAFPPYKPLEVTVYSPPKAIE